MNDQRKRVAMLEAKIKAYLNAGDRETAGRFALDLKRAKDDLAENEKQLALHEQAYQNNLLKIQHAVKKLDDVKHKIGKYDAELKMSRAEAEMAELANQFHFDVTTDFGQAEQMIQDQIDRNRAQGPGRGRHVGRGPGGDPAGRGRREDHGRGRAAGIREYRRAWPRPRRPRPRSRPRNWGRRRRRWRRSPRSEPRFGIVGTIGKERRPWRRRLQRREARRGRPGRPPTGARAVVPWFPSWAREFADQYFAGTTCVFVLHGNVHDLIRQEQDGRRTYGGINEFLATQLFGTWDVVLRHDLSQGLRVSSRAATPSDCGA